MNFQFIYKNLFISNSSTSNNFDYHGTDFLMDWQPYELTYWESLVASESLTFGCASMDPLGYYIVIDTDNFDTLSLSATDSSSNSQALDYTETIQGRFRILEITTSYPDTTIITIGVTTTESNLKAGQVILTAPITLNENPDINVSQNMVAKTNSLFRSLKNNLIRQSVGVYNQYKLVWTMIANSSKIEIQDIYMALNEHGVIMNLGDLDNTWVWVGLSNNTLTKNRVISDYWNIEMDVEDLLGSA